MSKKIYRSRTDKKLGGVAGGIARYFSIDPSLVRLLWVIASLYWGAGLIFYIAAWIIIPEEPEWDTIDIHDAKVDDN